MSFKLNAFLISAAALGLSACASAPSAPPAAPAPECAFPNSDNKAPAPLWICDAPVEGMEVGAVGSHPKSAAGIEFQKTHAMAAARVKLAQQMKIQVQSMIKQYAETTGAGKDETVDQVYTSVTKQITDQTLVGTKLFRSAQGPDGTMYVLVGIDAASTQKIAEAAVKTSMNNEKALWQKFQAGKAQDEMAAEIAKQKVELDKSKQ